MAKDNPLIFIDLCLCFQLCPMWVAPNVLTFVGFLITITTFLILSYYDASFYASSRDYPEYPPIPNWVFLVAAFNVFIAYTLGNKP